MSLTSALPLHYVYLLAMAAASTAALATGWLLYIPAGHRRRALADVLRSDWKYIGVAWLVTLCINALSKYHVRRPFTDTIHELEGATVAVFQTVTADALTTFFVAVYLVGFPFVVLFTYVKLKVHDPEEARRYVVAYVSLVLVSAPFFLLFPVQVSGYVLPEVEPLLYQYNPVVHAGSTATDTLMKAFPSLHTGLSVLAAVYARKTDRRYAWTAAALATAIVLSTFYLGVHWLTDATAALAFVALAYGVSRAVSRTRWRAST